MKNHALFAIVAIGLTAALSGCGSDESPSTSKSSAGGKGNAGGATGSDGGADVGGSDSAGGGPAAGGNASLGGDGSGAASGTNPNIDYDSCPDTSTANATLTGQYNGAGIAVVGSEKTYQATTNWWHKYTDQTITLKGIGYVVDNSSNVSVPATDGAPIGYPTIFIGTYAGSATKGSNLPKQVSALTSVPTLMETNALELDTSNFNAAYDVWFTASGEPLPQTQYTPGPGGAFLMVWLFDPAGRQPRGRNRVPGHTVAGLPGTWDVWIDSTNPPCISYVSTTPLSSLGFDLNAFIRDSVDNAYGITDDMYLSVVFGGFEIWGGGDGLELKRFCASVK